jgi:adenylate kinase
VEKEGKLICRVCGCEKLTARADDQDEAAIDKRHNIYYDTKTGTLAAVNYFKQRVKVIEVDGNPSVKEVSESLLKKLV